MWIVSLDLFFSFELTDKVTFNKGGKMREGCRGLVNRGRRATANYSKVFMGLINSPYRPTIPLKTLICYKDSQTYEQTFLVVSCEL